MVILENIKFPKIENNKFMHQVQMFVQLIHFMIPP